MITAVCLLAFGEPVSGEELASFPTAAPSEVVKIRGPGRNAIGINYQRAQGGECAEIKLEVGGDPKASVFGRAAAGFSIGTVYMGGVHSGVWPTIQSAGNQWHRRTDLKARIEVSFRQSEADSGGGKVGELDRDGHGTICARGILEALRGQSALAASSAKLRLDFFDDGVVDHVKDTGQVTHSIEKVAPHIGTIDNVPLPQFLRRWVAAQLDLVAAGDSPDALCRHIAKFEGESTVTSARAALGPAVERRWRACGDQGEAAKRKACSGELLSLSASCFERRAEARSMWLAASWDICGTGDSTTRIACLEAYLKEGDVPNQADAEAALRSVVLTRGMELLQGVETAAAEGNSESTIERSEELRAFLAAHGGVALAPSLSTRLALKFDTKVRSTREALARKDIEAARPQIAILKVWAPLVVTARPAAPSEVEKLDAAVMELADRTVDMDATSCQVLFDVVAKKKLNVRNAAGTLPAVRRASSEFERKDRIDEATPGIIKLAQKMERGAPLVVDLPESFEAGIRLGEYDFNRGGFPVFLIQDKFIWDGPAGQPECNLLLSLPPKVLPLLKKSRAEAEQIVEGMRGGVADMSGSRLVASQISFRPTSARALPWKEVTGRVSRITIVVANKPVGTIDLPAK